MTMTMLAEPLEPLSLVVQTQQQLAALQSQQLAAQQLSH